MLKLEPFETRSLRLEWKLQVAFFAPVEDVDRIMQRVCEIAPLVAGSYDSNAWQSAGGIERYRPRQGAVAGTEQDLRKRPGVVEVVFQLDDDQALLEAVLEAIYEVHSYQEQTITVTPALASRTRGLDDSANPHRWWNTTGD